DFHLLSLLSPRRAELERIGTAVIEICRITQYFFSCHLSLVNLLYHSIHVTAADSRRSGYNHNFVYTAWQHIEVVPENAADHFKNMRIYNTGRSIIPELIGQNIHLISVLRRIRQEILSSSGHFPLKHALPQ